MQKKGFFTINRDTLILITMSFHYSRALDILKGVEDMVGAMVVCLVAQIFASTHSETGDFDCQIKH